MCVKCSGKFTEHFFTVKFRLLFITYLVTLLTKPRTLKFRGEGKKWFNWLRIVSQCCRINQGICVPIVYREFFDLVWSDFWSYLVLRYRYFGIINIQLVIPSQLRLEIRSSNSRPSKSIWTEYCTETFGKITSSTSWGNLIIYVGSYP
jgi:hypothetical protein